LIRDSFLWRPEMCESDSLFKGRWSKRHARRHTGSQCAIAGLSEADHSARMALPAARQASKILIMWTIPLGVAAKRILL
jgi:hypothetical protein